MAKKLKSGSSSGEIIPKVNTQNIVKNTIVRPEMAEDVVAIEAVIKLAFLDAPHTNHAEQFILAALRDAGALAISLVAEIDGAIVGSVAVSPVFISDGTKGWFGLGPVAVIPKLHGRGIGSQLIREALNKLRGEGASGCVVLGEPSYYQRFGFKSNAHLILPDIPTEYFMALLFETPMPSGTVSYHQAFGVST